MSGYSSYTDSENFLGEPRSSTRRRPSHPQFLNNVLSARKARRPRAWTMATYTVLLQVLISFILAKELTVGKSDQLQLAYSACGLLHV